MWICYWWHLILEQAKFTCSSPGKYLKKNKNNEDQGEKQVKTKVLKPNA